jgi:hypothetical protein
MLVLLLVHNNHIVSKINEQANKFVFGVLHEAYMQVLRVAHPIKVELQIAYDSISVK